VDLYLTLTATGICSHIPGWDMIMNFSLKWAVIVQGNGDILSRHCWEAQLAPRYCQALARETPWTLNTALLVAQINLGVSIQGPFGHSIIQQRVYFKRFIWF